MMKSHTITVGRFHYVPVGELLEIEPPVPGSKPGLFVVTEVTPTTFTVRPATVVDRFVHAVRIAWSRVGDIASELANALLTRARAWRDTRRLLRRLRGKS